MNTQDVLMYGHFTFLNTLERVPKAQWGEHGVCGAWSTRDIIAHLTSYELMLVDVIGKLAGQTMPTPVLDEYLRLREGFNDKQVENRRAMSMEAVIAEYHDAHDSVKRIIATIPNERFTRPGTLPWYGDKYSFEDFVVYQYYGHKREHSAQIAHYADSL